MEVPIGDLLGVDDLLGLAGNSLHALRVEIAQLHENTVRGPPVSRCA